MWKFERIAGGLLLGLLLLDATAQASFLPAQRGMIEKGDREASIAGQQSRLREKDSEELRTAIDDTQAIFDAFALESGRLDEAGHKEIYADLKEGSKLPQAVGDAAKALGFAEELVKVKGAIRAQQDRIKAAASADQDAEESRLLGLQSDQMGLLEDLRKRLRSLHKELNEDQVRDLRNWAMVNDGVLRRRHEEEDLRKAAQKEAEALPLDASATGLTDSAEAMSEPPASTPVPTPVPKKAAKAKDHGKPR